MKKKEKNRTNSTATVYIALVGLNYGDPEKRIEIGEEVDDLPADSVPWLLEQGYIKPKEVE